MHRSLAMLLLLPAALLAAEKATVVESTTVDRLKKDMAYLASDEMGGRGTGSPEIEKAADYIASQFKAAGLQPAGKDGTYFQPFTFNYGASKLGTPTTLTLDVNGTEIPVKYAAEFTPTGMSPSGKVKAGVVFAGYGISLTDPAYDDYANLDVKGKIVILLRRAPKWDKKDNPFQKGDNSNAAALIDKADLAAKKGAVAVLFVNDKSMVKEKGKDELMEFKRDVFGTMAKIPLAHVKRDVVDQLLKPGGKTLDDLEAAIEENDKPQSLAIKDVSVALEATVSKPQIQAKNVVGTLPGAGPLSEEVVVIGAHYDHVGRNEHSNSAAGKSAAGKIHFGADDNGSGTCGLLELVRRFGAMKNRQGRRLVFVSFTGEELGLFGSKHYVNNPPFPLEKTVMMLNMDMIGRSKPIDDNGTLKDRIVVYGHGTAEGLEKFVDFSNALFNFKMFKVPGGNGPSDHDSFYKKKIPVLFFFTGTHTDYHKPTDTAEKINYTVMAKVVDMVEGFAKYFSTTADRPKYAVVRGGSEDPTDDRPRPARGASGPRLGVMPDYNVDDGKGMAIEDVSPGGAAEKGGMKAGDIIISIAGKDVKNVNSYMEAMSTQKPGVEIEIVVLRKMETVKLKVTPAASTR